MHLTVIIFIIVPYASAQYNITKMEPGIIFENIGSLQVQASAWKIATYVNLSTYFTEFNYVTTLITNVEQQCNLLKGTDNTQILCDKIVAELNDDAKELEENNRFFVPRKSHRSKRGQINIVGHALKFLFGTMDNTDAIRYQNQIYELEKSQIKTKNMLSKQQTMMVSTFEKLNEVIESNNDHEKILKELEDEVSILIRSNAKAEYFTRIHYLFEDLAVYIKITVDKIRRDQIKLFDITTSAHHGLIHQSILNPEALMNTMKDISADLRGTMFPLPLLNENLYKILALGDFTAVYTENILIFEITTPLVTSEKFQIYKITTVPAEGPNHTYTYITPTDDMLVVTESREKYFYTNKIQLTLNGKIISGNHHLLKSSNPMYILHSRPSCETICLIQGTIDGELCQHSTKYLSQELWIQLEQQNSYIFILPRTTLVSIRCSENDQMKQESIGGIGLLQTDACEISTNYITLPAVHQGKRNFTSQFRRLNIIHINTTIERPHEYIRPTAITSHRTIRLLDAEKIVTITGTEDGERSYAWIVAILCVLTFLTIGLYGLATWIWFGSRAHARKRIAKEVESNE